MAAVKPRIVVSERMHEPGLQYLRERANVLYAPSLHADCKALQQALAAAEALIVGNRTEVTRELALKAPKLRVVGRLGSGLDNIDTLALERRGVALVHARGANAAAVAEYIFAALLWFARPLAAADADVRQGGWHRDRFIGFELFGKTMFLLGLGEVGRRVAARATAFGVRLLASDPLLSPFDFTCNEMGAQMVTLDEGLRQADMLVLALPLTPLTRGLIDTRALARLPAQAVLINASRGGIVDEEALACALRAGSLRGAALDVRSLEPPDLHDTLRDLPQVLLTPHIAGWSHEALQRISRGVAEGVLAQLQRSAHA